MASAASAKRKAPKNRAARPLRGEQQLTEKPGTLTTHEYCLSVCLTLCVFAHAQIYLYIMSVCIYRKAWHMCALA